jgi:alanyl-tRNA synthetase
MTTIRRDQIDPYTKELDAEVQDLAPSGDGYLIVLDQTIFFPESGGQPGDKGTIKDLSVVGVYEKGGIVYHKVVVSEGQPLPKVGEHVHIALDWDFRFDNMQRHCGEHILSGIFFHLYGAVNRGFHMGDDSMTIDMNLEVAPPSGLEQAKAITWEMAMVAEEEANKAIWSNLPVTTRLLDSKDDGDTLPLRKSLAIDNNIRIVCVGDPNNPADCVACCGTHPAFSGEVGIIKILKLENYKGMTRVHFEAGKRGYKKLQEMYDVASRLGVRFSVPIEELEDRIKSFEEKNQKAKEELYHIKHSIISERQDEIRKSLSQDIMTRRYSDLKTEDLMVLGRGLMQEIPKLLIIVSEDENTLLLFSNGLNVDCGKLVKDNASIYNGKGGGNKESARALFPKKEYLDTFIDLIEKHLR